MSSQTDLLYTDDDLRVIVQDWDESATDQAVAINLARECLRHRRASDEVACWAVIAPSGHIEEILYSEENAQDRATYIGSGWTVEPLYRRTMKD